MKKVLWISHIVPYDNVPHAGGQIHNYYLKQLHAAKKYDIRLVSYYKKEEYEKIDLDQYGIKHKLICLKKDFWGITRKLSIYNPLNRYANFTSYYIRRSLNKTLKELKDEHYNPDIIILQWTQIILHIEEIKRLYPSVPIISIEEDVSYLKYKRKRNVASNIFKKMIWDRRYRKLKILEIHSLSESNLVVVNNVKDENLLLQNKELTNIWCWCPYYNSMLEANRQMLNNDILFYGAMNRDENWKSAIWFIENVFCKITEPDIRFVIAGNKPPKELQKYESDRIKVLGFVENVTPLFQNSLCMVAPLVMGAGVKIKVIEALSAGIPVLTNEIGIEGIPAENGRDFFYCESPDDYITAIRLLQNNELLQTTISKNAKEFIKQNFNFEQSTSTFMHYIDSICDA